jgi:hypothetical protein
VTQSEGGSANTFLVRYPDGSTEFRMSQSAPELGDVVAGRGERWLVADIAEQPRGAVTVSLQRVRPGV